MCCRSVATALVGTCCEAIRAVLDALGRAGSNLQQTAPVVNLVDQLHFVPPNPVSPSDPTYGIPPSHRPLLFPHYNDPIGHLPTSAAYPKHLDASYGARNMGTSQVHRGGGLSDITNVRNGEAAHARAFEQQVPSTTWSGDPDSLEVMATLGRLRKAHLL